MQPGLFITLFALIFAVNIVAVFWAIVMYFAEMGSEEGKKEYKNMLIGAITSLILLMVLYGVLTWLGGLVGL